MKLVTCILFSVSLLRSEEPARAGASAPISELHAQKLLNLDLQEALIRSTRQNLIQQICTAAKFMACQISGDYKTVYEVLPPRTQPGAVENEPDAKASSQPKEKVR